MDEAVRERDIRLKDELYDRWCQHGTEIYKYPDVFEKNERLKEYVKDVINFKSGHNLYEALSVQRFFDMLKRYEYSDKKVRKFYKFYESLRFNGAIGRTSYKLTPVQCFQYANIFGFVDGQGRRITRTAYIFVPRKFSKTTSAASLTVWDMLFGDENAQSYVAANSYNQACICFKEIKNIMFDLDPRGRHFKINREEVTFKNHERESSIACLSGDAKTKDGLMASTVIIDEYAQARNTATKAGDDLKNTLTTSMGTRRQPLTVIITTASDVLDGPFYAELEGVKRLLRGEMRNDSIFASLFMPDPDDREDDPNTWRKVQPHLGITVQPDYYEKEWQDAQISETKMVAFRNKMLNIFAVNNTKMWFTHKKAEEIVGDFDIDNTKDVDCAVSFDLSTKDDFSAVTYTVYSSAVHKFYSHTDYYFPEGSLEDHPNKELYKKWISKGYLTLCEGDRIDVLRIAQDISRRSDHLNIIAIAYDSYKAPDLVNTLIAMGAKDVLHAYKQTQGSFNLPVEAFEMLAYSNPQGIELNRNPINTYCLTNCVIDEDHMGNKKPYKVAPFRKIDGTITLLMTLGEMYNHER